MTGDTGGNLFAGVTAQHQLLSPRQGRRAGAAGLGRRRGRVLCRKILGNFAQVIVRQVFNHIVHQRILAPSLAKVQQLVVQVAGRLAGDAGKEGVVLFLLRMAGGARLDALLQAVVAGGDGSGRGQCHAGQHGSQ
ncbi:hypothetical protein D3C72_1981590 [compost metagenome]